MAVFRKDFEKYEPYIIDDKAKHNLGDNENRLIDWSDISGEMSNFLKNYKYAYYGTSQHRRLKQVFAEIIGVEESNLIPGVGSDQIILLLMETFMTSEDTVLTISPDFSMYEVFATIHGVKFETYDMPTDFNIKAEDILRCAKKLNAKLIILSQPNNPTSVAYNPIEIEDIIKKFDGIVAVDEAYLDFSNLESFVKKINLYNNLVVLKTLSKSFGLAGLRLGFAISNEALIYEMNKVIPPYNLSDLIAEFATVALLHKDKAQKSIKQIIELRDDFKEFLKELDFKVLDSQTNFLTFTTPFAKEIYDTAMGRDFYFKYYTKGFLKNYIRLSIGTEEEMEELKNIILEVVKQY